MANLGRGAHHPARSRCEAQKPSKPLLSPAGVPSPPGPVPRSSCSCRVHHLLPSVPCSHRQPDAGIPPACGDRQAPMGLTAVSLSSKLSQVDSVRNRGFVSRVGSETGLRAPTGRSSCRVLLEATSVPEMLEGAFPRPQATERPPRNDVRPILSAAKGVEVALAQTCAKRAKPFSQGSDRL